MEELFPFAPKRQEDLGTQGGEHAPRGVSGRENPHAWMPHGVPWPVLLKEA
jgi:hypothetical protein